MPCESFATMIVSATEQNFSRFRWRQVCQAAMHCISQTCLWLVACLFIIASSEGHRPLLGIAFVAGLDMASSWVIGACGDLIIAALAAYALHLLEENARLRLVCNTLQATLAAETCTVTEPVRSLPQDVTVLAALSSNFDRTSTLGKQDLAAAVAHTSPSDTACGPETPTQSQTASPAASRRSSVSEKCGQHQELDQQASCARETSVPLSNSDNPLEDMLLLPTVNLTCKLQPTAPAPVDSPVAEPASPEGPCTPTRLSDAGSTAVPGSTAACGKNAVPALPPVAPPLPTKQVSSGSIAAPKPPPPPPPPPPRPAAVLKGRQPAAAAPAAAPPPPPTLTGTPGSVTLHKPASSKPAVSSLPAGVRQNPEVLELFQSVRRHELAEAGIQVAKGGAKAAAAAPSASTVDTRAAAGEVLAQMIEEKFGKSAKVADSLARHRSQLVKAAADISSLKVDCLEDLVTFAEQTDALLAGIEFGEEVLLKFGSWPASRYALIREVAAAYRKLLLTTAYSHLKSLTERTKAWMAPSYKTSDLRTALRKQFGSIESAVAAISSDATKLMGRSKEGNLPWTPAHTKQLTDAAKLASLNLACASMAAAMKEATDMRLSNMLGREQAAQQLQQRRLAVLGQSVRFVIVVYRFVGGFDAATQQLFATFAAMWGQVAEGIIQPQAPNPPAAAAAAAAAAQ